MFNRTKTASVTSAQQSGFSLIELLVVLAILGLLVSLVAPRMFGQVDKSKITTAQAQAKSLKTSVDALQLDIGRYPTEEEGLSILLSPPSDTDLRSRWFGPYIDSIPDDPWGNPYVYALPEGGVGRQSPRIISYGADGEEGGAGLDEDISL